MTFRPALSLTLLCALVSFSSAETIFVDLNDDGDNTNDAILLSELENGGVIEFEGKVFSGFGYSSTGNNPDSDGVNVIPIIDCDGNPGLRFQGGFLDMPDGNNNSDALISFGVSVEAAPGMFISDMHLAGNPDIAGPPGSGLVSVTETFLPTSSNLTMTIYNNGAIAQLSDWIVLDADDYVTTLQVQKDIILFAGENAAGATLSFVDQTFSMVPEPTGLALFGLALAGLAMRRRR